MKLSRKAVLKWLKNLRNGDYIKGTGRLVSNDGTQFCCLGVWADQHGATWLDRDGYLIPIPKGRARPAIVQSSSTLKDKRLTHGLTPEIQNKLVFLNDDHDTWGRVIDYIEKELLPEAV